MNMAEEVTANDIDIKKIFFSVYDYKWLILFFMLFSTLITVSYAYFLPNVYAATATVKVGVADGEYAKDVISIAMGNGARNAATEKDLILSRSLSQKALKYVDFRERYYEIKHYKKIEVYKKSAIKVQMKRGYGLVFDVQIIDNHSYQLILKEKGGLFSSDVRYDKVHRYGEVVKNDYFEFILTKVLDSPITSYQFSIDEYSKVLGSPFVRQSYESSTVLHISVEDTVALRAKEYANALAQAYVQLNIENKTQKAKERLSFIDKQLSTVAQSIENSDGHLEDFRKESKIVDVEHISQTVLERLDKYESRLMDLESKEKILDNFYEEVQNKEKLETLSIEGIEDKESILAEFMKQLQEAVVEQKVLGQDYTDLHPRVIKMNHKIIQLKSTIRNTVKNLVLNLKIQKELLQKNIKKQKKALNLLPQRERKFGQLERNFKMNEEIKSYLLKQQSEAQMVKASQISKNKILDLALLPYRPIKPKRISIVLMGGFLGLCLGLGLAFLRIFLDSKIQTEEDISKILSYPILGIVPHIEEISKKGLAKIKVFESVKSATAESFRNIRSNLEFMRQKKGTQIVLLTSTVGQEGKTTLAVNLAAIMSLSQKRTVIVNLDFRKPTLHKKFNLKNDIGLTELINERVVLKDVIQCTAYPYLDIIPSGTIPPNPSELMHNQHIYTILEEIKKGYDIIILDTPPIGLVTDVKELMHYVDMNIYIVRSDYSRKEFLENLKKMYQMEKVPQLSFILNDVKKRRGSYGYYDGHGYYEE